MVQHQYKTPQDCDCVGTLCEGRCNVCDGGLSICKVCGLAEGSLTSECPGEPAFDREDRVYRGEVDYRGGRWIEGAMSRYCPEYYAHLQESEGLNEKPDGEEL